jgi:hypothetical protein
MIINTKKKFIYNIGVYTAQDKVQWWTLTNITNNWTPQKAGNLSSWATTRFLRTTFFHEVSLPVIYTSTDQAQSNVDKIKFLTAVIKLLLRGPMNSCSKVLSA